jgi:hypothetical protein
MALKVPQNQVEYIKKLLELPDESVQKLLDAIVSAAPQFNTTDLTTAVSRKAGLPIDETFGIIGVLKSMYLTRNRDQSIEQFIDRAVFGSLKRADIFSPDDIDAQWKRLRPFLISALSQERSLGTAIKAGEVLTAHERIFAGAKILTDLRPVFHVDVSERPDAAMIVHMLRITQRDDYQNQTDFYFALDSRDIVLMKGLLDRAAEKESTLKELMKDARVAIIEPKPFF